MLNDSSDKVYQYLTSYNNCFSLSYRYELKECCNILIEAFPVNHISAPLAAPKKNLYGTGYILFKIGHKFMPNFIDIMGYRKRTEELTYSLESIANKWLKGIYEIAICSDYIAITYNIMKSFNADIVMAEQKCFEEIKDNSYESFVNVCEEIYKLVS